MIDQTVPLAVVAILNLGAVIAVVVFGLRQQYKAEARMATLRHKAEARMATVRHKSERRIAAILTAGEERFNEAERRSTAMLTAGEKRFNRRREARLNRRLDESEQRLTRLITAVEERSKESERRLTELYREVNRDAKTLLREVGFIRGSLGVSPSRQGNDPDGAAESA